MSTGPKRYHNTGFLHFITFSCVRHHPMLGTEPARDIFCELLERTREIYIFEVHGYVIMPEHVHMILGEPEEKPLSVAIQILKQRFSKTRSEEYVWESRYYDFTLRSPQKRIEKALAPASPCLAPCSYQSVQ